jgi:hypothetical protein
MREKDFDTLIELQNGKVNRVAMHPTDVTELNDGCEVPWISGEENTYDQKGIVVVLDTDVPIGQMKILDIDLNQQASEKGTCPLCGNPTYQPGLCLTCQVDDLTVRMNEADTFLGNHVHYLTPLTVEPGSMVGRPQLPLNPDEPYIQRPDGSRIDMSEFDNIPGSKVVVYPDSNKLTSDEPDPVVGGLVNYIDRDGRNHHAIIIHIHSSEMVNLVYVPHSADAPEDIYGKHRKIEASVPFSDTGKNHSWNY